MVARRSGRIEQCGNPLVPSVLILCVTRFAAGGGIPPVSDAAPPPVSEITVRVNYSETDQMGVVYHARYLVWLDIARTDHLRQAGMSYRELEEQGYRLAVSDLAVRFRQPARYDDLIRVRCWLREVASRRLVFGYAVELADSGRLLATATTTLIMLDAAMRPVRVPSGVAELLRPIADPIRLD